MQNYLRKQCLYSIFSGQYFPTFRLNTDQKIFEYGDFLRSVKKFYECFSSIQNIFYYNLDFSKKLLIFGCFAAIVTR